MSRLTTSNTPQGPNSTPSTPSPRRSPNRVLSIIPPAIRNGIGAAALALLVTGCGSTGPRYKIEPLPDPQPEAAEAGPNPEVEEVARMSTEEQRIVAEKTDSAAILLHLSSSTDTRVLLNAAKNSKITAEAIDTMVANMDNLTDDIYAEQLFAAIAQLKITSAESLDQLSKSRFPAVRAYVAEHKNTLAETLFNLRNDESALVRFCVSCNDNTSDAVKAVLSEETNWCYLELMPQGEDFLTKQAFSLDEYERGDSAQNLETPIGVLSVLTKDSETHVAKDAAFTLAELKRIHLEEIKNSPLEKRLELAKTTRNDDELDLLSQDKDPNIRMTVAGRVATPKSTLQRMAAEDPVPAIRQQAQKRLETKSLYDLEPLDLSSSEEK